MLSPAKGDASDIADRNRGLRRAGHDGLRAGLAAATALPAAAVTYMLYSGLSWLLSTMFISERQRRAPADLQARVGIAGRMLLLGAVAAGSALATVLAGKAGVRVTYLAMAVSAAVITVAAGSPLIRRAGLR